MASFSEKLFSELGVVALAFSPSTQEVEEVDVCDHGAWVISKLATDGRHTCDFETELDERFGLTCGIFSG